MVKRFSLKGPRRFPVSRPGREHQCGAVIGVLPENTEHAALIVGLQMEKTMPGNQPVEAATQHEFTHIGDHPALFRKSGAANFYQGI
ncbi:hypothetical protein D3C71_2004460 [compost metagenome]